VNFCINLKYNDARHDKIILKAIQWNWSVFIIVFIHICCVWAPSSGQTH